MSVVITRNKFDIPPENYLWDVYGDGSECDVMIAQAADSDIYVSLGQPFVKTYYTSFDYGENLVYFGVSTTVTAQGEIRLFPPIVWMYLGFTIAVLPPIIAAFCMEYNYCPKRRRAQRAKRVKRLRKEL